MNVPVGTSEFTNSLSDLTQEDLIYLIIVQQLWQK